eukprot:COSAG02_NODE_33899_length_492_cov_1.368957_1_plen_73_part_00
MRVCMHARTGSVLRCEMVMVVMFCSTAALYSCSSASMETAEVHSCNNSEVSFTSARRMMHKKKRQEYSTLMR